MAAVDPLLQYEPSGHMLSVDGVAHTRPGRQGRWVVELGAQNVPLSHGTWDDGVGHRWPSVHTAGALEPSGQNSPGAHAVGAVDPAAHA